MLGKSDGGSAFRAVLAEIAKPEARGTPSSSLLAFFLSDRKKAKTFRRNVPACRPIYQKIQKPGSRAPRRPPILCVRRNTRVARQPALSLSRGLGRFSER